MLFQANHPELSYHGGQESIIHLEADLHTVVAWAQHHNRRWAFTLSNAGSRFFEDRCDLKQLDGIDWDAVQTRQWAGSKKEGKQAEFLLEYSFPWHLIERIGVYSRGIYQQTVTSLRSSEHRPSVLILPDWYY